MNFPALLHFSEKRGVLLAAGHEQKAAGFAVEPTDKGKKLLWVMVPEPIDEGKGAVRPGRVDQPVSGLIHDQEGRVIEDDGGLHGSDFEGRCKTSKGGKDKDQE